MRVSNWLGLTAGWLVTSLGMAFDVGVHDLIFFPTLVLGVPALVGLVMAIRRFQKASPPETLQWSRLIGFAVLGVLLMTAATLGLIAAFYWGEPLPQG